MIVGVIGSGGREHSICEALYKSKDIDKIFCFPGNAGTATTSQNIDIDINDYEKLKKFNCKIVPIYIQTIDKFNYKLKVNNPIDFNKTESIQSITDKLNIVLEEMILKNPEQWIWSHNRWK